MSGQAAADVQVEADPSLEASTETEIRGAEAAAAEAQSDVEPCASSPQDAPVVARRQQPENEVSEVEIPNVGKILVRADADGYNEEVRRSVPCNTSMVWYT